MKYKLWGCSTFRSTGWFDGKDLTSEFIISDYFDLQFIDGKTHNHLEFHFAERGFIYLPFEHSESKEDQVSGFPVYCRFPSPRSHVNTDYEAYFHLFIMPDQALHDQA